jgi:hypothetical protein
LISLCLRGGGDRRHSSSLYLALFEEAVSLTGGRGRKRTGIAEGGGGGGYTGRESAGRSAGGSPSFLGDGGVWLWRAAWWGLGGPGGLCGGAPRGRAVALREREREREREELF